VRIRRLPHVARERPQQRHAADFQPARPHARTPKTLLLLPHRRERHAQHQPGTGERGGRERLAFERIQRRHVPLGAGRHLRAFREQALGVDPVAPQHAVRRVKSAIARLETAAALRRAPAHPRRDLRVVARRKLRHRLDHQRPHVQPPQPRELHRVVRRVPQHGPLGAAVEKRKVQHGGTATRRSDRAPAYCNVCLFRRTTRGDTVV
jgi:hypothetical protein